MAIVKLLIFAVIIRPFLWLVAGWSFGRFVGLPMTGPAIIVANHNSHLDTLALTAMFPLRLTPRVRAVAASEYFLQSGGLMWFAANVLGIIGLDRRDRRRGWRFLDACSEALTKGDILIVFPEGTRGKPEHLGHLSRGIAHLAKRFPNVPVVPVVLHGLGRVLPRGAWIPLPYCCDARVRAPLVWTGQLSSFMSAVEAALSAGLPRPNDDEADKQLGLEFPRFCGQLWAYRF